MSRYAVVTGRKVERHIMKTSVPRERPAPNTADLALMRAVLGLPAGAAINFQTLGSP